MSNRKTESHNDYIPLEPGRRGVNRTTDRPKLTVFPIRSELAPERESLRFLERKENSSQVSRRRLKVHLMTTPMFQVPISSALPLSLG